MQRLRLKADGRIVELRDGQEFPLAPAMPGVRPAGVPNRRRPAKPLRCLPCATCAAARSSRRSNSPPDSACPSKPSATGSRASARRAARPAHCSPSSPARRTRCLPRLRRNPCPVELARRSPRHIMAARSREHLMHFIEANGAKIPAIGLGTWELRGRTCARLVEQALRLGYRHIDTAQVYENEREVGEGLRASGIRRNEVFITTKIWTTHFAPHDLERSTKESLNNSACPRSTCCCCTGPIRRCRCRRRWVRWRMSASSAWRGISACPTSPWP